MSELMAALRRLFGRGEKTDSRKERLDRERAASMVDEGGAAAAEVEAQPGLARAEGTEPTEPGKERR